MTLAISSRLLENEEEKMGLPTSFQPSQDMPPQDILSAYNIALNEIFRILNEKLSPYSSQLDGIRQILDRIHSFLKPFLPWLKPFLFILKIALFIWRFLIAIVISLLVLAVTCVLLFWLFLFHPSWLPGSLAIQAGTVIIIALILNAIVFLVNGIIQRYYEVKGVSVTGVSSQDAHKKLIASGFIALPPEANLFVQKMQPVIAHPLTVFFCNDSIEDTPVGFWLRALGFLLACPFRAEQYYVCVPWLKERLELESGRLTNMDLDELLLYYRESMLCEILPWREKLVFAAVSEKEAYLRGPMLWTSAVASNLEAGRIALIR